MAAAAAPPSDIAEALAGLNPSQLQTLHQMLGQSECLGRGLGKGGWARGADGAEPQLAAPHAGLGQGGCGILKGSRR